MNPQIPLFMLLIGMGLSACTPEPEQPEPAQPQPKAAAEEPIIAEAFELALPDEVLEPAPTREMDWSLPADFDFGNPAATDTAPDDAPAFDAGPLFWEKQEPQKVKATVIPLIKESDDPDEVIVLDGGKVSIEVKTK